MIKFFEHIFYRYSNAIFTLQLKILDVGQRSPMTDELEKYFKIKIDSTSGDLDDGFIISDKIVLSPIYDIIIYSHTIEHQFNPLYTLLRLKEVLKNDGRIFISVINRGKLLWHKYHYHEIDRYRMSLLLKRAGLETVKITRKKLPRHWYQYIGFRPLLRLFVEWDFIYEIKKYYDTNYN